MYRTQLRVMCALCARSSRHNNSRRIRSKTCRLHKKGAHYIELMQEMQHTHFQSTLTGKNFFVQSSSSTTPFLPLFQSRRPLFAATPFLRPTKAKYYLFLFSLLSLQSLNRPQTNAARHAASRPTYRSRQTSKTLSKATQPPPCPPTLQTAVPPTNQKKCTSTATTKAL